jgi:hypothetical protein
MSSVLDIEGECFMEDQTQPRTRARRAGLIWLAVWTLVWLASAVVARFGPSAVWHVLPVASWIAIALNVAAGVVVLVVHARYLRRVDELQRKVTLDAMAIALGVAVVGGIAYALASTARLVTFDANTASYLSVLVCLVYGVATVVGNLRYR